MYQVQYAVCPVPGVPYLVLYQVVLVQYCVPGIHPVPKLKL